MPSITVNFLHVLICAIIIMAIGAAWYSKALFANQWSAALGKKMEDFSPDARRNSMVFMAVGALVTSYFRLSLWATL